MLSISSTLRIPDNELVITAIRAAGPGGQNVNKVASAIQLRFDIGNSSLPDYVKQRLLELRDRRITRDGVIVIKAQRFRDREKNRQDALERLRRLVASVLAVQARRLKTRVPTSVKRRRLDSKTRRGRDKSLRGRVRPDD